MGINVKVLFKNLAATLPGVDGATGTPAAEEVEAGGNQGFRLGENSGQAPNKKPEA